MRFCYWIFWFSRSKVSDANVGIFAYFCVLWENLNIHVFGPKVLPECLGHVITNKGKRSNNRCGSRIWSRGGPQVLRPKVADVAKRSCASEVSNLRPGSRACLRALEAFGFLMLKYAFSHILETLFL